MVQTLVREDPRCCRATKPMYYNYRAHALGPVSHNYWALVPRACEKLPQGEAHSLQRRVAPTHHNERKPLSNNEDPAQPKKKKKRWDYRENKKCLFFQSVTMFTAAVLVSKSRLTLCNPMDCNPPGFSVHGIFQAILEWIAMPSSRRSSEPRDQTRVSYIAAIFFTIWTTSREVQ